MTLRPFFRIVGTKTNESLAYAVRILRGYLDGESRTRLVEPFCGSGSVTLATEPPLALLADANPHIILAFKVLQQRPKALLRSFNRLRDSYLQEPTKDHFYTIRDNPPDNPIDLASWFVFIVHASFNWLWRTNKDGVCNTTAGDGNAVERVRSGMRTRHVEELSSWLTRRGVQLLHSGFADTLSLCGEGDVVYCDPPYIGQFDSYTSSPFGAEGYQQLHDSLHEAWERGAVTVVHSVAEPHFAAPYQTWCRVLCHPCLRRVQPKKVHTAWEMIIVSQPRQIGLFDDKPQAAPDLSLVRPEDFMLRGRGDEARWNDTTSSWEHWPPHEASPCPTEHTGPSKEKPSATQMGLWSFPPSTETDDPSHT